MTSTADDLLRRALDSLDGDFPGVIEKLKRDIAAYLDAPKDEPVECVYVPLSIWKYLKKGTITADDLAEAVKKANAEEKLHPPTKTAPMTREEILAGLEGWDWHPDRDAGFYAGIRFAERHHGITDVRE